MPGYSLRTLKLGGFVAIVLLCNSCGLLPPQPIGTEDRTVSTQVTPRMRYRLGNIALAEGNLADAAEHFQGLDRLYPALASRIQLKLALSTSTAPDWLDAFPDSPLVPEALAFLALQTDSVARERLLREYPNHPRTLDTLKQLLIREPDNREWMAHLVRHFPNSPGVVQIAGRWSAGGPLSAQDWQAVAETYQPVDPSRAEQAYRQAPQTAENLLAHARILKVLGERTDARRLYERLLERFPRHAVAIEAQLEWADLLPAPATLEVLARMGREYPERTAAVLWGSAQTWANRLNNPERAGEFNQQLVEQFPENLKAPNAAWELASMAARRQDWSAAEHYAEWLIKHHPDDPFAPKAGFWLGKWAERNGNSRVAAGHFRRVLANYPRSYYAWRSAVHLGLAVGDFDSRTLPFEVEWSRPQPVLPYASATVRELFEAGEIREARNQWQAETYRQTLGPLGSLTDAILRARNGEYQRSINQAVRSLVDTPDSQAWEQAYPLFFEASLRRWSDVRGLNPLLVAALIRQESRFEPAIRSRSGAVGLMQVMPATGRWIAAQESGTSDLSKPGDNLRLGTWYLDYTHRKWNGSSLLAIASYNAGPGNVSRWVREIPTSDPETFIERIPFRETRFYVVNVYENYWNYLRLYSPQVAGVLKQL
ncbi:MAG: transglycosylase SLT domain-containing protein [Gemmatimonadaceae bacterium]|nr:transglycosylase SLT domain-containing protein [Gloeobacterales cyanobacterium ES-bin-141]